MELLVVNLQNPTATCYINRESIAKFFTKHYIGNYSLFVVDTSNDSERYIVEQIPINNIQTIENVARTCIALHEANNIRWDRSGDRMVGVE
jgi:hypothetical protein